MYWTKRRFLLTFQGLVFFLCFANYINNSSLFLLLFFLSVYFLVITFLFSLNQIGFLTDGSDKLRGNYGLADQIQALKWIKKNIAAFRGNPNRITLFGNSAGGSSVGFLSLSPIAKGLSITLYILRTFPFFSIF